MSSEPLEQFKIGHFGFSGVKTKDLGATGYTLVTLVCDRSGSTAGFQNDMESAVREVVKSCAMSPRADNLLLRVLRFDNTVEELHGFKLLESINPSDYEKSLPPRGSTALFDAMLNGIEATNNYGKELSDQDYDVNAILFFITDGEDNASTFGINQIKDALSKSTTAETIESIVTVLIGVNVQLQSFKSQLESIHQNCGLSQFVNLADANSKTLAKLANFVSQSISSQSQAIGSGGPSQAITF